MIIRQLALRHGHRALSKHATRTSKTLRRLTTKVESIEASLANSIKETHLIEASINTHSSSEVSSFDPEHLSSEGPSQSVADAYNAFKQQQNMTAHLGTSISPHYQPHTLVTKPPSPKDITLELLLASQAHLGHKTSLWNPANQRYIFGIRQGIHIISLDITAAHLRRAAKVVTGVCERAGVVLFVGTRFGQDRAVVNAARLAGGCHLFQRWIPGSITNGQQILGKCRLKVVDDLDREMTGFDEDLVDRPALKPDLVVCLNPLENFILLQECGMNNIPTIGIVDTDADPTWVTYPIPANDDSLRCVQIIAGVLGKAGEEGQQRRCKAAQAGRLTYEPDPSLRQPY